MEVRAEREKTLDQLKASTRKAVHAQGGGFHCKAPLCGNFLKNLSHEKITREVAPIFLGTIACK